MTGPIRVSILKEESQHLKALVSDGLSRRLGVPASEAGLFMIANPTPEQREWLRDACEGVAQSVFDMTGQQPLLEIVQYDDHGTGSSIWRANPRQHPPITEAAE